MSHLMTPEAFFLPLIIAAIDCAGVHPPVIPQPYDASDAAPWAVGDGGPGETPCQRACDVLARFCGPQLDDCATSLAHTESGPVGIRESSGRRLTCADLADAGSKAAVQALAPGSCP